MTAPGDRLHQAAMKIREATNKATPGQWEANDDGTVYEIDTESGYTVIGTGARSSGDAALIALMASPPLARELADWLDDIAADKEAVTGAIHPRAVTITDLILGDPT